MNISQQFQNAVQRRLGKRAAFKVFTWRVRWYALRGRIQSVGLTTDERRG